MAWWTQTLAHDDTQALQSDGLRISVIFHPQWQRIGEFSEFALPNSAAAEQPVVFSCAVSRQQPLFQRHLRAPAQALSDPYLSRRELMLNLARDGGITIYRAQCPTTVDVNHTRLTQELALPAESLARGIVLTLAERVVLHIQRVPGSARNLMYQGPEYGLVGHGPAVDAVRDAIQRLCRLEMPVLIRGESGTGKELVARALHEYSSRNQRPFIAVNAAAIPASLASAELFGAQKGAYTGNAQYRRGYLEQAGDGSLFLDEVGDLPGEVQTMLLRVLETHQYQPLGGSDSKPFKARLIAATDVDLQAAIGADRFRAALYHRLSAMEVHLPALRDQQHNIGLLLFHLLQQEAQVLGLPDTCLHDRPPQQASWIPAGWLHHMALADWPGNVRQLRNVARQMLVLGHTLHCLDEEPRLVQMLAELQQSQHPNARASASAATGTAPAATASAPSTPASHQPIMPPSAGSPIATGPTPAQPADAAINGAERLRAMDDEQLEALLEKYQWRLLRVARALQVPRSSLYDRIHRSPHLDDKLQHHRQDKG